MASSLFGWDLLYKSVEADVKNNQDVLVCFTHLVLISNGFKCIGLGDSKNLDGTETKTEILPKGWTDNYAIRYVYQGRLYNLRATNMDDAIMINLIRVQERTVSMVQLNTAAVIQRTGSLEQMLPNSEELAQTIKKQLIDKVAVSAKYKDTMSQTASTNDGPGQHSQLPSSSSAPHMDPNNPLGGFPLPRFDPLSVGRSDLDPLGGLGPIGPPGYPAVGGGGMLFVPPRGPRLDPFGPNLGVAPGSIPPGARFDPFRPPDADRFPRRPNRPDNDEFPPPGFDDMYM